MCVSPENYTYVRLLPYANVSALIAKVRAIVHRNADPSQIVPGKLTGDQIVQPQLVALADVHLEGDEAGHHQAGNWTTVYGFAAIAVLILVIAYFNFTNLATARATCGRAKSLCARRWGPGAGG